MPGRPRQALAWLTIACSCVFACAYGAHLLAAVPGSHLTATGWAFLVVRAGVEVLAGVYGIAFVTSALAFLGMRGGGGTQRIQVSAARPRVGVVYLCCDDADWSALESLSRLSYPGPLTLVIHDDSRNERARRNVDLMAARLVACRDWDVRVLRRPSPSGGKAGAVNYVLAETAHLYEYFLLCDNDSTVVDPHAIQRALRYLEPPEIAGVQFRCVAVSHRGSCGANRRLADSISAFHAFLAPAARHGWMPFIGHNALLRTQAVQEVGGFTPGFFSDDLDLTVRLNMAGFRMAYAPEIEMGEKHPPSYTAFRKRSYKWAYGCVQTLRAHWLGVVRSRRFSLAEKLSFFQFATFYCAQCAFLAYLVLALVLLPLRGIDLQPDTPLVSLIIGSVLVLLVYAPLLSYYLKNMSSRRRGWLITLALCGLVYGGTDFSVFRGVVDAFAGRRRQWIPTNHVSATAVDPWLFAEALFGLTLLAVPVVYAPELLYLPSWFLFAGKFLFAPALSLIYRDEPHDALASFAGDDDGALRRDVCDEVRTAFDRAVLS